MPFSLLDLIAKQPNFKSLPEFSGVPFFSEFSHQWTNFRKKLVSLGITPNTQTGAESIYPSAPKRSLKVLNEENIYTTG